MTTGKRQRAAPRRPAEPTRALIALTATDRWYLDCFVILAKYLQRPPTLVELAGYVGRSVTPTYMALKKLVAKGYLRQVGATRHARRFEVIT